MRANQIYMFSEIALLGLSFSRAELYKSLLNTVVDPTYVEVSKYKVKSKYKLASCTHKKQSLIYLQLHIWIFMCRYVWTFYDVLCVQEVVTHFI